MRCARPRAAYPTMIVRGVVAARRRPCLLSDPLTPGPGGSTVDEVLPAPDPAPDRRLPRRRRARWTTPGRPMTPSARQRWRCRLHACRSAPPLRFDLVLHLVDLDRVHLVPGLRVFHRR